MERPVGDKFKLNGCVYVVVRDAKHVGEYTCDECAFFSVACARFDDVRGKCLGASRRDGLDVHFVLVEDDKQALL